MLIYLCVLDSSVAGLDLIKNQLAEPSGSGFINIKQLSPRVFSLNTNKVNLSEVLKEFSQKSGTIIHYNNKQDATLTVNCKGEFLAVMYCLSGDTYSLIIRHQENLQPMSMLPEIAEIWLVQKTEFEQPKQPPKYQIDESKAELIDSFLLMAKDPVQRIEAISQLAVLATNNDVLVKSELIHALSDNDAQVRAQAVFGLGKYHQNDSIVYLRQALSDENLDVRLMALEQSTDYPVLLEQALKDSEVAVRDMASMKLKLLSNQHNKN